MKAWITKYALTEGIFEVDARVCGDISQDMIAYRRAGDTVESYCHGRGRDWHTSYEGAACRARAMRDAKIRSIEKQIARLRSLEF